jgi:hypothetical protein
MPSGPTLFLARRVEAGVRLAPLALTILGAFLLLLIFELIRSRRLRERYALLWLLTGLTRDGVFLIEKGKITRSLKNFRWNESPLLMLNNWADVFPPQLRANRPFQTKKFLLERSHECERKRGMPDTGEVDHEANGLIGDRMRYRHLQLGGV